MKCIIFFIILLLYGLTVYASEEITTLQQDLEINELIEFNNYYENKENLKIREKLAYKTVEELIINKFHQTPIGQSIEGYVKILICYSTIEYRKTSRNKTQILLPGEYKSSKCKNRLLFQIQPNYNIDDYLLVFDFYITNISYKSNTKFYFNTNNNLKLEISYVSWKKIILELQNKKISLLLKYMI